MNKMDFVREVVAIARETTGLDSKALAKLEDQIRCQFAGETVRIAPRPPVTYEDIDAGLRQRKSVRVMSSEFGISRSTIYRMLESKSLKAKSR